MPIRASESGRRATSSEPRLTFTTGMRYDTKFLLTGQVLVRGVDIHYTNAGQAPSANFHDMVTKLSYDIGEQAFSHYLIAKDMGKALTAIPVFVSRFFPFTGARVSRKANISRPQDLAGSEWASRASLQPRSMAARHASTPLRRRCGPDHLGRG